MNEKCFVIMPFTTRKEDEIKYNDNNHWTEVYEGLIKKVCEDMSIICERDDVDKSPRHILNGILNKIEKYDFVLCDLSSSNPNVLFELGWAMRADRPIVLINDDRTDFLFDLNQFYTCIYDNRLKPSTLEKNKKELSDTIQSLLKGSEEHPSFVKQLALEVNSLQNVSDVNPQEYLLKKIYESVQDFKQGSKSQGKSSFGTWTFYINTAIGHFSRLNTILNNCNNLIDAERQILDFVNLNNLFRNQAYQFSLIDMNRRFIYHDWKNTINPIATKISLDSFNIYDIIIENKTGIVAWQDNGNNALQNSVERRENIAVYAYIKNIEAILIFEIHNNL